MKTINYILIAVLVVFIILIITLQPKQESIIIDENLYSCNVDTDCVPLPSECHTKTCINKEYVDLFEEPDSCTMIFDPEAAYTEECCTCIDKFCTNRNLGRTIEDV